jgi:hypothetical protein
MQNNTSLDTLKVGKIVETQKNERFECTGIIYGKLKGETKDNEYKILQRLNTDGSIGKQEFYYTDEQWKKAVLDGKIKFVN